MWNTKALVVTGLILAAGIGIGFVLFTALTVEAPHAVAPEPVITALAERQQLIVLSITDILAQRGVTAAGLSPYVLLEQFPAIAPQDFSGAEAIVGRYEMIDGVLTYIGDESRAGIATADLSEAGMARFLTQFSSRVNLNIMTSSTTDIVTRLSHVQFHNQKESAATSSESVVMCTMDAMLCPDGSYVGRTGPDCEFAPCGMPVSTEDSITCTPEEDAAVSCTTDKMDPVCAFIDVPCVGETCAPERRTYSNSCFACRQSNVSAYVQGSCTTTP